MLDPSNIRQTIEELKRHVVDLDAEAIDTKRTVNSLCRKIGDPAAYTDAELEFSGTSQSLKGDEYFNKPMATAARMVLEARYKAGLGPATIDELYDAMLAGGYAFEMKTTADAAKRGVSISLAKNTTMFVKLPSGKFGLAKQYGVKEKRATNGRQAETADSVELEPEEAEAQMEWADAGDANVDVEETAASKPK